MEIGVCTEVNHIELQHWPVPEVGPEFVLVKVSVCGICGSDVAAWRGSGHKTYPYAPGHEFCGTIERMGERVTGLSLGQRVVIDPNLGCGECDFCRAGKPNICDFLKTRHIKSNGGLAEYAALDYRMVHPLPDELPDDLAPFIEPLSCALHAANTAAAGAGDCVIVCGAGLMGFLTGVALAGCGAEVTVVEPSPVRARRITELLALPVMTPAQLDESDLPGRVNIAIDCSGSPHAVAQAVRVLRKTGRLVLGGIVMNPADADISFIDITTKELRIEGIWLNPNTFPAAVELAVASRGILEKLDTETFGLADVAAGFERAASAEAPKVLVRPKSNA